MSFTLDVKEELISLKNNNVDDDLLELEAILRFSSSVFLFPLKLDIQLNSMALVRLTITLLKKKF